MKNIKVILRNQGKTQLWLAAKLGVRASFLNTIITRRRRKPIELGLLNQIVSALSVDLYTLCYSEEVKLVSKICHRCNKVKPLESFGVDKSDKSGCTSYCLICCSSLVQAEYNMGL